MAQIDPKMLLQAALQSQASTPSAAAAPAGAPPPAAMGAGAAASLPAGADASGVGGVANTGGLSNVDLAGLVGSGSELSQDPAAMQQMVALLQDPSTPPDQRAQLQMRLQLAALRAIAPQPTGAQPPQQQ